METELHEQHITPLQLKSIIGFGGSVPQGLISHPDGVHHIYPLGSNLVIQDKTTGQQTFLQGHTNLITCVAVSKSGKYVASGQVTHMGFQADIILWSFEEHKIIKRLTLHKVRVEAIAFSPNDKYLASLGGEDDNTVIVWDLAQGAAICGASASKDSSGVALCLAYLNNNDDYFVTGGHSNLRVWEVQSQQRKLKPTDCQMGQIKRIVKCITVDKNDEFIYCGTTTGDVLQINVKTKLFKHAGPPKEKDNFSLGVLCVALSPDMRTMIIGAGDGTVASLAFGSMKILNFTKVLGKVTSITFESNDLFNVSTAQSNIYQINADKFETKLLKTCHYGAINDICFPMASSDVFATASDNDIRFWNMKTCEELLRISLPNLECKCIVFKKDGSSLISGWSDGKIRAFGPQSGRLQYEINDAHKKTVTALAVTEPVNARGDFKIISGGEDGQLRIWNISRSFQVLENAMKEHKGTITCIKIRHNNSECVSSSSDGSCIIWDLSRYVRNQVLFAPSFFKAVCYYPEESQLLTGGTDRKIGYWETYDGSLIRELDVPQADAINGLDITLDGKHFVIGGSDKLVKLYRYEEGDVTHIGSGHSTDILKVRISPDQSKIVSVSTDGAVFIWGMDEI
ncbi:WD40-repeat-containing domain protein [Paraphysoderma sedebokerense]|nr:WD40-repeat-containing domain protein [Paraphysoderma sedebokerense]